MSEHSLTKPAPAKVAVTTGAEVRGIVPTDLDQVWRIAQAYQASGLAPKGLEKAEAIAIAIMHGLELGLHPMQALQSVAVVNGKPTIYGDAALALVHASGLLDSIVEEPIIDAKTGEVTGYTCTVRRRSQPSAVRHRFTADDAKRAGLLGKAGPWTQYRSRMLQMRARGFALRDAFPDVLRGLHLQEEIHEERDVTPRAEGPGLAARMAPVVEPEIIVDDPPPVKPAKRDRKVTVRDDQAPEPPPQATESGPWLAAIQHGAGVLEAAAERLGLDLAKLGPESDAATLEALAAAAQEIHGAGGVIE